MLSIAISPARHFLNIKGWAGDPRERPHAALSTEIGLTRERFESFKPAANLFFSITDRIIEKENHADTL